MSEAEFVLPECAAVAIGEREIGPHEPVYVIAEAGVNHNGSVEQALRLVDVAVEAGADAVKFQVFRAADLVTETAGLAGYQQGNGATQREMLARLELSDAEFHRIRAACDERGIEFLATPFGVSAVDLLVGLQVRAIKIASTDLNNVPLLHRVVDTELPLIVSTGAATRAEIHSGVARLCRWSAGGRLILFHCVSCYPVPLDAANLRAISTLQQLYSVPCGLSDHTTSTQTGAWAVAAGACILEKHFTLDKKLPGPDHAMSLDPGELTEYVATVRQIEDALGTGRLGLSGLEGDVREAARRSVVANCDIPAETELRPDMLAVKRPAGGIEPDQLAEVVGRTTTVAVARDTMLTWDMVR